MKPEVNDLDPEIRERLNAILHKQDHELTLDDKEFLKAREFYIKDKHKPQFPSVFGEGAVEKIKQEEEKIEEGEKKNEEKRVIAEEIREDIKPRLMHPAEAEEEVRRRLSEIEDDEDEIEPTL